MVAKDVSLNSKVFVKGDVSMDSILMVAKDVSLNSKLFVRGNTTMNGRVDVCGNFYAQYPNTSIPKSAINGPLGLPITFGTIIGTDISSTKFTDISAVYFDTDAGFDITEITNGEIKVSMNSTFKYWDLSGQVPVDASNASTTGLVAQGLDTMNFVAGNNIQFDLYTTGSGNNKTNYFKIAASVPNYSNTALIAGNGLNVTSGDVSFNNHLSVNGDVSFNRNLDISGDLTVRGNLSVYRQENTAIINTTINNYEVVITKDISLNGNLVVSRDASLNSKLYVKGDASFNGRVDICGNLYAQYPAASIPVSAINAALVTQSQFDNAINTKPSFSQVDVSLNAKPSFSQVDASLTLIDSAIALKANIASPIFTGPLVVTSGDVSFNSKLRVNGDASFNGRVDICGNLYAQYPPNSIPRSAIRTEIGGSDTIVNNRNQSFYDVITQQPQLFTKNASYTDGYSNTTKVINVYWTYDDILAKISNSVDLAYLNFLDASYKKTLPNIDKVYIDVSSGNITNGWARYNTLNITSNYNTNTYKSITITRKETAPSGNSTVTTLLATTPLVNFDVRVYGENGGATYPTVDARSLIYRQIAFKEAKAPGQPLFVSKAINSFDQITLTYNFNYPETGDATSPGLLSQSQTKYTQSDTLSSTAYALDQNIANDSETDENVAGGSNFTVVLNGLRAGTKYNFLTRVQNDLSIQYSISDTSWNNVPSAEFPYDSNGPTQYTTLPSSGAYTSDGPSTLTYAATNNITTSTLSNANVIYVNIGNSGTISPTNSTAQSFQITNPSAASSDIYGYGKWIDNSTNLVQVKAFVDDSQKQVLSYNGFTPSAGTKTGTATIGTSSTGVNYFSSPTQADIYSGNSQTQGFRLYGTTQLLQIASANVQSAIGQARSTPYQLKLEVTRDTAKVGGSATVSATSNIYVDNLSLDPTFISTNTPTVVSVVWTMGIPSVKKYKIDCARTYNNINSTTGFIRGDRNLSAFTGITSSSNTASASSGFTTGTISIAQNAIQSNGTYIYDATAFSSATSTALQSLHYTSAILGTSTTLTVSETAYSLKTGDSGLANNTTVTVSHHFDMSSYNNYGTSLSTKLTLTDIYEITDATISTLNNDLGGLGVIAYTDHTVITKNWTLLYYSGKFQTNSTVTYPNVTSYTWNGLSGSYTYNAGANGLDLTGTQASSGTRYKWIVFKLNKLSNTQYSFNGTIYNVLSNNENNKYLSVKAMLSDTGLFNSATITALFNDANTDAIGFCRATKAGTSVNVIGNLKQVFDPLSGTWSVHGTATTGYTNSLSPSYGSKITNSNGDFGIYTNPTAINNDLYLFIGLKI
jgi:cytoskeletal protein CcmA (bactofilin family)